MDSGSQLSRTLYRSYLVSVLSLAGCYRLTQVRWVDQTQYPMIVVASLSAVPQSCCTPLPNQYLDCMLLADISSVHTHTPHSSLECSKPWDESFRQNKPKQASRSSA